MKSHVWKPVAIVDKSYTYHVDLPAAADGEEPRHFSLKVSGPTSMLRQPWLSVADYWARASIPLPDNLRLCESVEEETEHEVPADVRHAAGMLGGMAPGNVLTPEDYECLATIRKWIYGMEFES